MNNNSTINPAMDSSTLAPTFCIRCGAKIYCATWIDGNGPYCQTCASIKRIRIDIHCHFPEVETPVYDWEPRKTSDYYYNNNNIGWSLSHNTLIR